MHPLPGGQRDRRAVLATSTFVAPPIGDGSEPLVTCAEFETIMKGQRNGDIPHLNDAVGEVASAKPYADPNSSQSASDAAHTCARHVRRLAA